MKKFLEAGKADTRVLGKAERHILSRPLDTSRRTDVLHPSEMSKVATWCHRASYFQILGYAPPPRKTRIGLQTQMVFDEGHYIHANGKNFLLKWEFFTVLGSVGLRVAQAASGVCLIQSALMVTD